MVHGRPFALRHALLFAAIVAAGLLLASWLNRTWGESGVLAAAAATGLADVRAAAVGLGQLVNGGGVAAPEATLPEMRRVRLLEMADAMDMFCQGTDGDCCLC